MFTSVFTMIKCIYIKKSSIFANLLMEKPGNCFSIVKLWKKHLKQKYFKKKICIFT